MVCLAIHCYLVKKKIHIFMFFNLGIFLNFFLYTALLLKEIKTVWHILLNTINYFFSTAMNDLQIQIRFENFKPFSLSCDMRIKSLKLYTKEPRLSGLFRSKRPDRWQRRPNIKNESIVILDDNLCV